MSLRKKSFACNKPPLSICGGSKVRFKKFLKTKPKGKAWVNAVPYQTYFEGDEHRLTGYRFIWVITGRKWVKYKYAVSKELRPYLPWTKSVKLSKWNAEQKIHLRELCS